jgi:hypothetical protein
VMSALPPANTDGFAPQNMPSLGLSEIYRNPLSKPQRRTTRSRVVAGDFHPEHTSARNPIALSNWHLTPGLLRSTVLSLGAQAAVWRSDDSPGAPLRFAAAPRRLQAPARDVSPRSPAAHAQDQGSREVDPQVGELVRQDTCYVLHLSPESSRFVSGQHNFGAYGAKGHCPGLD